MTTKTVTIASRSKQSNSAYHRTGKPTWWVAYQAGDKREFVKIPYTRGDVRLEVTIEIPADVTELFIGAGKTGAGKSCDPYRETIAVKEVE